MLGELHWYERLGCNILQYGTVPRHIAFIMDGNRRYAKSIYNNSNDQLCRDIDGNNGYLYGYNTFVHQLDLCYTLGIQYITVYAFAVDNFNRSENEINTIMSLAYHKFIELSTNQSFIHKYNIKIKFIGNRSHHKLSDQLKLAIEQCEQNTAHNTGAVLNICFVYSSTDEVMKKLTHITTQLSSDTVPDGIIQQCNIINDSCPVVDLLIRTSGETRFSDFLLYYIHQSTHICFIRPYWPQLNIYHFMKIILEYQYYKKLISNK